MEPPFYVERRVVDRGPQSIFLKLGANRYLVGRGEKLLSVPKDHSQPGASSDSSSRGSRGFLNYPTCTCVLDEAHQNLCVQWEGHQETS